MKYLGINLPMIVKDIYLEKHNTLMKEIETEKSDQDRRVVGCESHTSKIHLGVEWFSQNIFERWQKISNFWNSQEIST